ncbi:unnamed protein product [Prorocentrum cordatum]|uniref:Uncharacterized protein n=1 Tax=Prorocentrum cordatum TaxID=2364126 RepID=A0ABN9XA00_9DINO|nr:unnamed protein product [Polarella glacialis]
MLGNGSAQVSTPRRATAGGDAGLLAAWKAAPTFPNSQSQEFVSPPGPPRHEGGGADDPKRRKQADAADLRRDFDSLKGHVDNSMANMLESVGKVSESVTSAINSLQRTVSDSYKTRHSQMELRVLNIEGAQRLHEARLSKTERETIALRQEVERTCWSARNNPPSSSSFLAVPSIARSMEASSSFAQSFWSQLLQLPTGSAHGSRTATSPRTTGWWRASRLARSTL